MKKIEFVFLAFITMLFANCKKNDPKIYDEKPAVYFSAFSTTDSLFRSLVAIKTDNDTVWLNIQLLGNAIAQNTSFKLVIDPQYSTAIESKHYQKLKDNYVLPAGKFSVLVPIILYKTDPDLTAKSVRMGIKIISSDDLDAGYQNKLNAHIIFTNQLVKPSYWDSYLSIYYGTYSRVKHTKAIQVQQFDFPDTKPTTTSTPKLSEIQPKFQDYGRQLALFYTYNVVMDENGNQILPWAPL
ncbi:DUF4843 domain-containing protein [Pedobacter sp. MW01-1-1]|uniref:DUF4843 domain-containing protein n=1 Tax=Pedobacter sp. MW01-1-1 TaxID=3383027 RepID=UPI003FEE2390